MRETTRTGPSGHAEREPRAHCLECTQLALDALLDAQAAAIRRPPFRVTPAHLLVGLVRQHRSSAGELLSAGGLSEERVWAAFDYRKRGAQGGLRRLRDPVVGAGPRWTRAAREVVFSAARESQRREASVVDTIDLLRGIGEVGDAFAAHLLAAAHLTPLDRNPVDAELHLVELERCPTTQLPTFTTLGKMGA